MLQSLFLKTFQTVYTVLISHYQPFQMKHMILFQLLFGHVLRLRTFASLLSLLKLSPLEVYFLKLDTIFLMKPFITQSIALFQLYFTQIISI